MEPRIQYAKTADGLSIAFWTKGQGLSVVDMPPFPYSHVHLEWQFPEISAWYERMAAQCRVVRYDARGTGLSTREIHGLSFDALVADLESVVATLGPEPIVLFGAANSGPVAIAYAAKHPERVARLILWCTYARGADYFHGTQTVALQGLLEQDWQLFTETTAHVRMGWAAGEPAHRFASMMREAVSPEVQRLVINTMSGTDVSELLPQLRSPTLVLHRREFSLLGVSVARGIASEIPSASLLVLEGSSVAPYLGDVDAVVAIIGDALGRGEVVESQAMPQHRAAAGLRTVIFTDLVGHTEMMQRLGDARGRDVLREHERITRETLKLHAGAEIKTMGDGFLASFGSVTQAMECAIALQRAFAAHSASMPEPLHVRVGLNAGEPIEEEGDLFGSTVILASRIAAKAEAGEILVPETVRGLLAGKSFVFADRGEFVPKGFDDAVRLFEVRWRD